MGPPEGAARATDAMPGRRTASRVGPIGRGGTLRRGEGRRDRGSVRRPRGRLRGGGARRGRGCGSEGVRSRLGGREGGRRRRDRLVARPDAFRVFFPGAPVRPAGRCLGGGARSIAARSRSRARAPGRIPPRDDPSDRLDDADERVRGGSGRPRPSRARAPAPGRRSGGPAPRHDPPPSRKRRKKRAGRLRETVARGRRDASRTSEARVNLACVSARRSRRWAGSCAERDAGSGARDRPRHHPFANLLTRGTSPRARRARAPAGAPKNARTNSLQNWNF